MSKEICKVVTVVGARPQFVKAAALSPALKKTGLIKELIIHTGQHFDHVMSDIFFQEMSIPSPAFNLQIGGGTHGENTGRMIEALERVFLLEKPDAILVYGDTDSTLAAAVACSKLSIKLIHVEAGLRSRRKTMPEEINRLLTDHVSDILYATSKLAYANLLQEGIPDENITISGDVMYDVVKKYLPIANEESKILAKLNLQNSSYDVLTLHRKETVDDFHILAGLLSVVAKSDVETIFLVHPRTMSVIQENSISIPSNIRLVPPVGYFDMLRLVGSSRLVLTDSGGLQKEAYFLGKACVTLREETEWVELVHGGVNFVVGVSSPEKIEAGITSAKSVCSFAENIYGDGSASQIIANDLVRRLS